MRDSRSAAWWLIRSMEVLVLVVFAFMYFTLDLGISEAVIVPNLVVFYMLLARAVLEPDRIASNRPTYFTIETLFLVFYFMIFYLPYQQYLFGSLEPATSRFVMNTYVDGTDRAITLSTVGAIAFVLAYRFTLRRSQSDGATLSAISGQLDEHQARHLRLLSRLTCVLLIGLMLVYLAAGWRTDGEGRYTDTSSGGIAAEGTSVIILMLALVAIGVWLYQKSRGLPPMISSTVGLLVAIAWSVRLLTLGDRNSFLLIAIALVAGIYTFWKRAPLVVLFVGLVLSLVLYNAVEILRVPDLARTATLLDLVGLGDTSSEDGGESSFNITTITLRAAVVAVPDQYGFTFGIYKIIGVLGILPFFRGIFVTYFAPTHYTSAEFLGDVILGPNASWNVGSNVVADSYLEFGVLGVVAFLGLAGCVAATMRNRVSRNPESISCFLLYVVAVGLFAELPRYSLDFPVRVLVWSAILVGATKILARPRATRASQSANGRVDRRRETLVR